MTPQVSAMNQPATATQMLHASLSSPLPASSSKDRRAFLTPAPLADDDFCGAASCCRFACNLWARSCSLRVAASQSFFSASNRRCSSSDLLTSGSFLRSSSADFRSRVMSSSCCLWYESAVISPDFRDGSPRKQARLDEASTSRGAMTRARAAAKSMEPNAANASASEPSPAVLRARARSGSKRSSVWLT
eukprot:CAMPEP_0177230554 /NCGR_PEP_ID=MMETSP0367-20130122/42285_1 /TAXON_ID=447022 ORGANISM="Scrippsiella hangoei-like, Strain SHHI-4" /NCGR_SAMPLE_ID=MMETSP0367 /ASSEMBLY_ACC=CAM_ASM_000362 /LENGTH=189 /DNA_ID=CAMNT_0018681009 /DNA_START=94 /DNA_END=663 /DNA_ORIENTATION=-